MDNNLVERVKEYNRRYKEATSELSNLKAQMNVYEQEVQKLCNELSSYLGVEVTKENALDLYNKKKAEIENNLSIGNEILDRISSDNTEKTELKFEDEFTPVEQPDTATTESPVSAGAFTNMFNNAIDDI